MPIFPGVPTFWEKNENIYILRDKQRNAWLNKYIYNYLTLLLELTILYFGISLE